MDVLTHLVRKQQVQGLSPAPAGVTPNFGHPVSHGHYLSLASVVCVIIAAIFTFARLWVKLIISHAPGWDDVTAVSALICSLAFSTLNIITVNRWGLGHHVWEVPATSLKPFLQYRTRLHIRFRHLLGQAHHCTLTTSYFRRRQPI